VNGGASSLARALLALAAGACAMPALVSSQSGPDADTLLARIGERLAGYYQRAQRIVCVETSTVQPIGHDRAPDGLARTVQSELRVEDARLVRDIRHINGRAPRERDKKDRSACTDPDPFSTEPLAFLLPEGRGDYRFTGVRAAREKDRDAWVLEFTSTARSSRPELIEDPRGHDDCFDWSGPVAMNGRVWVDAASHDVLRVERYTAGPVDIRVPRLLQRRYSFDSYVVLDRDELSMRYKAVTFEDPKETLLVPDSIVAVTMLRSGLQSVRRTTTFSDYRRFLTSGRIKDR